MLFDRELNRVHYETDCLACPYYSSKSKSCSGLGIKCNEYDVTTNTVIDMVTGLPLKMDKKEKDNGDI